MRHSTDASQSVVESSFHVGKRKIILSLAVGQQTRKLTRWIRPLPCPRNADTIPHCKMLHWTFFLSFLFFPLYSCYCVCRPAL